MKNGEKINQDFKPEILLLIGLRINCWQNYVYTFEGFSREKVCYLKVYILPIRKLASSASVAIFASFGAVSSIISQKTQCTRK